MYVCMYVCIYEGLFRLNVESSIVNKIPPIVCFTEACDMWHLRLRHVNKDCMRRMMNLELIPKLQNDINEKCQTCVEAKQPRKPFKSV